MKFSKFGNKIACGTGIGLLMDDLGKALAAGSGMRMLGGGNPARIPEVQARFRQCMESLMRAPGRFEALTGLYDTPRGYRPFIDAFAGLMRGTQGWDIGPENVALTNGSQMAFFILFNLFGGTDGAGKMRRILLPLTPEYIGYADAGIEENLFVSKKPKIAFIEDRFFKYHVDFEHLEVGEDIGAICVSRPSNPTGNVLTDGELDHLRALAKARDIPLIIDNAYGAPFPDILFAEAKLSWDEHTILCMSLSKLGLPSLRTGIVVAPAPVIQAVGEALAVMGLAPNNMGPAVALELVESGEILRMGAEIIQPYYRRKMERAVACLREALEGVDYHIHKPEGALFLWLWLRGLPITSQELYERLKQRGCLVVPGHHFFPGLAETWEHRDACLRITYSQEERVVAEGLRIIGEEVRRAYG